MRDIRSSIRTHEGSEEKNHDGEIFHLLYGRTHSSDGHVVALFKLMSSIVVLLLAILSLMTVHVTGLQPTRGTVKCIIHLIYVDIRMI